VKFTPPGLLTIALYVLPALGVLAMATMPARAETEEPKFTVLEKPGPLEIRQYVPRIAAEVVIKGTDEEARSGGFSLLADYIFGNNTTKTSIAMTAPVGQQTQGNEKIAMTAPVAQTPDASGSWKIRFYMPSKYTMETLPKPNNPAVKIISVPGETVAILQFSNSRSTEAVAAKTAELLAALSKTRWQAKGATFAWFYDPPWTLPFFRRNEVGVEVAPR
jgi:hypothetical protein